MITTVDDAVVAACRLEQSNGRAMLGIIGPPGAGKSTLAAAIAAAIGPSCSVVPMDGFHLGDAVLRAHGALRNKGRIETFDGWGYLQLLRRLRTETERSVFAPGFERTLEQPIAAAIEVPPQARLVITEGNYLLDPAEPWSLVRGELDEVWYCEAAEEVRRARLLARHVEFGKSPQAAGDWIEAVDEPNSLAIAACRPLADRIVALG